MLVSKLLDKINNCLDIARTLHLSNVEEQQLTVALFNHLTKLNRCVLSNQEKKQLKKKIHLMNHTKSLKKLKVQINSNKTFILSWYRYLSIKSNILLNTYPKHTNKVLKSIFFDLKKIFSKKFTHINSSEYIYLDAKKINSNEALQHYLDNIQHIIKTKQPQHIIIPSKCFIIPNKPINQSIISIAKHIKKTIILDVCSPSHFKPCFELMQKLMNDYPTLSIGLSLHTNIRQTIYFIDHIMTTLTSKQKKQFILRITKGNHWSSDEKSNLKKSLSYYHSHQLKMNTFYKWSLYTIFNYIRKYNIRCHIQSNNLYDISWGLILRAQFKQNNYIKFETEINKFPNYAKIFYLIYNTSVQTQTYLVSNNKKENITIILNKFISQGSLYQKISTYRLSPKKLFIKSHSLFFKYLEKDFISIYLNHQKPIEKQQSNTTI